MAQGPGPVAMLPSGMSKLGIRLAAAIAAAVSLWAAPVPAGTLTVGPGLSPWAGYRQLSGLDLHDMAGRQIDLSGYRGRVLVLYAWTTWCWYCHADIPELLAAARRWRPRGVEVALVNLGESRSVVGRTAHQRGYAATLLLDPGLSMVRLGVFATPTAIVVDPVQSGVYALVGPQRWASAEFEAWLTGLAGGPSR